MDVEPEVEPGSEQRGRPVPAVTPPRGRPWVRGQSGNPAGRPSRAHQASVVAHALIDRKAVPLTNKLIDLALAGDRTALRLCIDRIAPARCETPAWLQLPPIETRRDVRAAMTAVADAAAQGAISAAQGEALMRMLRTLLPVL